MGSSKSTAEAQLQDWIKDNVPKTAEPGLFGPPEYCLRRTNVGLFKTFYGAKVRVGHNGSFDFCGELSNGKRLEVELKGPGEKLSKAQEAYRKHLEAMGVAHFVAYGPGPEDFLQKIDQVLRAEGIRS